MGILSGFGRDLDAAKKTKAAQINGRHLKGLLKKLKEQRDLEEARTGIRPEIDSTTQTFMQKILDVWIREGRRIDEERFWTEVDHNRQFGHPVEYYERRA